MMAMPNDGGRPLLGTLPYSHDPTTKVMQSLHWWPSRDRCNMFTKETAAASGSVVCKYMVMMMNTKVLETRLSEVSSPDEMQLLSRDGGVGWTNQATIMTTAAIAIMTTYTSY